MTHPDMNIRTADDAIKQGDFSSCPDPECHTDMPAVFDEMVARGEEIRLLQVALNDIIKLCYGQKNSYIASHCELIARKALSPNRK